MPRPITTPTWATDAGRRIEPAAGEKASGFVEATRSPAKKANWTIGMIADWIAYFASIIDANDEHTYPVAKARTKTLPIIGGDGGGFTFNGLVWTAAGATNFLRLPIRLPGGAILNTITAIVTPGDASGTMVVGQERHSFTAGYMTTTTTATNGAPAAASTARQLITHTVPVPKDVVNETEYRVVRVTSGAAGDVVHGVFLSWDDLGPRNN